jgi:hypothetical protein
MKVRQPNMTDTRPDRDLSNYKLFGGSILVAHGVFVALGCNLHIGRKMAMLLLKQLLTETTCNVFDEGNTRLRIPNGRYHIVSTHLRRQLTSGVRQGQIDANKLQDRTYHFRAIILLAKGDVAGALAVLREQQNPGNGDYERYKATIANSTSALHAMITKKARDAIKALHAGAGQVRGGHLNDQRLAMQNGGLKFPKGLSWATSRQRFRVIVVFDGDRVTIGRRWPEEKFDDAVRALEVANQFIAKLVEKNYAADDSNRERLVSEMKAAVLADEKIFDIEKHDPAPKSTKAPVEMAPVRKDHAKRVLLPRVPLSLAAGGAHAKQASSPVQRASIATTILSTEG